MATAIEASGRGNVARHGKRAAGPRLCGPVSCYVTGSQCYVLCNVLYLLHVLTSHRGIRDGVRSMQRATGLTSEESWFDYVKKNWLFLLRSVQTIRLPIRQVESGWNVIVHGDAREGKWRGNWRMGWVASTLHTTSEHGVSSITTADVHTTAASSRLNWHPRRFKWTRPFRRKTKSGFCACAITFQTQSTAGSFPVSYIKQGVKVTNDSNPVQRLWMNGVIPPLPRVSSRTPSCLCVPCSSIPV